MTIEPDTGTRSIVQASTGPKTAVGKRRASQNALRHGISSLAPVLPGEDPKGWNRFQLSILDTLQPEDALEAELANRIALLYWRLRRVTAYEIAISAEQVAKVKNSSKELVRCEQLRNEICGTEQALEYWQHSQQLTQLFQQPATTSVAGDVAYAIFELCQMALPDLCTTEPEDGALLQHLLPAASLDVEDAYAEPIWTVGLLLRGLDFYAQRAGMSRECFTAQVIDRVTSNCSSQQADIRRLRSELRSYQAKNEQELASHLARHWLPEADTWEPLTRYEAHLMRQLRAAMEEWRQLRRGPFADLSPPTISLDILARGPKQLNGQQPALEDKRALDNGFRTGNSPTQCAQGASQGTLANLANGQNCG